MIAPHGGKLVDRRQQAVALWMRPAVPKIILQPLPGSQQYPRTPAALAGWAQATSRRCCPARLPRQAQWRGSSARHSASINAKCPISGIIWRCLFRHTLSSPGRGYLRRHVILVVLGENLGGFNTPSSFNTGRHRALPLVEQVGQDADIHNLYRILEISELEAYLQAILCALQAALHHHATHEWAGRPGPHRQRLPLAR